MGRRRVGVLALAIASLGLCGCPVVLVGAGAAAGYAISKDSVRNTFDLAPQAVYQRSLTVANDMGLVTLQDEKHRMIKVKIQDATVTITVKPLTQHSVELKVQARNSFLMPEVDTAQAVYNKIIEKL